MPASTPTAPVRVSGCQGPLISSRGGTGQRPAFSRTVADKMRQYGGGCAATGGRMFSAVSTRPAPGKAIWRGPSARSAPVV